MRRRAIALSIREFAVRLPTARLHERVSAQLKDVSFSAVFWSTATVLLCSLVLGGGTRSGFLSDAVLQLIAIPPLLLAALQLRDLVSADPAKWRRVRCELLFCLALILVPVVQLVPLPPALWTLLPGHGAVRAVFDDLGKPLPWLPISVSPHDTSLSLVALLPPLAVFLGTLSINYRERRVLSLAVIALAVVSAFLGLFQIAQGNSSPLRFFTVTNPSEAVGFFANRNHFAALLYVVLLFAAVWMVEAGFRIGFGRYRKAFETRAIVAITAGMLTIVILLAAEAMAHSRAGLILTIVSLAGAYALTLTDRRRAFAATPTNLLLLAAGSAVIFVVQFALYGILNRFAADPLDDVRIQFVRTTLEAVRAYLPFGSGMASFVPVYAMFERAQDLFPHRYVNHAHNDVIELWLEAGVVAMALMAAFAVWLVARSIKIWRRASASIAELDCSLARAATIAVALLLAHSFVDYPLRTAALMGLFAFACGLMVEPLTADPRRREHPAHDALEAIALRAAPSSRAMPPVAAAASAREPAALTPARQPVARWGADIDWPEAWRKSDKVRKAEILKAKPPTLEEEESDT